MAKDFLLRTSYKPQIMHYELCIDLGVPALPSGFPLYLFPLRSKRMPLQSLTQGGCQNKICTNSIRLRKYFLAASPR